MKIVAFILSIFILKYLHEKGLVKVKPRMLNIINVIKIILITGVLILCGLVVFQVFNDFQQHKK